MKLVRFILLSALCGQPIIAHGNELQRALVSFPAPTDSIVVKGWNLRMARVDSIDAGSGWEIGSRAGLCLFYARMSCGTQIYDLDSLNTDETIPPCVLEGGAWRWPVDLGLGQYEPPSPNRPLTGWLFEDRMGLATATFSGGFMSDLSVDGVETWLIPGDSLAAVVDKGRPYTLRTVRTWSVGAARWIQLALGR